MKFQGLELETLVGKMLYLEKYSTVFLV